MIKKALGRAMNSFMYSIGISVLIQLTIVSFAGQEEIYPVLPEFAGYFDNVFQAVYVQLLLIGLTSAVFGFGSLIMELERLSLLMQSVLYFIVTTAVWLPVGCICWGFHKYPMAMLSIGMSYMVSYSVSWIIQYRLCKSNVEQINRKLSELRGRNI